jgi:hypothetical protein
MKKHTFKLTSIFNSKYTIAFTILLVTGVFANAQTPDSLNKPVKEFRNSIKLNITSRLLYNNAFQLSYERVIKKNQTLNVFGGYQEFPGDVILKLDNTKLGDTKKKAGYSFGVDYRFYLSKENKYKAPHGVYLAPYISCYSFNADRTLIYTDSTGVQSSSNLSTQINFLNIGGELGYQFVLGKRWVIDAVVFGPALTKYNFKARLENNIPGLDKDEALQAVIDALKEKLPLLNDLSSEQGISASGTEAFWSVGFRYNISIGFRF